MRRFTILTMITLASALTLAGCKKKQKGLMYKSLSGSLWATGQVISDGEPAMWFQLFDRADKPKSLERYKKATDKVNGKYPAKPYSDTMIWCSINDRIEIRLLAKVKNQAFKDRQKLLDFLNKFDLAGLEAISGPKKTGKELMAYAPKLPMAKDAK